MDIQVLDLEQTFLVMGNEYLNPDDFELVGEEEESQILPVRIDKGFLFNLYLEKIDFKSIN